ncbi:hypothetical protein [Azospirillum rugosum]|uniref:Uncharacterized protein n=1 Tax=Azospirillum rugosum TaxID=416170 RepID=A0ABS4SJ85_9PROT|nr:hypothetical protein [Azospirillum rugosum]MBP2292012.1 hypothetical protein [Azospirillum rugosum]MDQ0525852.1 hypothetical protein [Azospirillum rugosum]
MRRLILIAAAAATLLSAPAFALDLQTGGLPIAPRMNGPFNPFAASQLTSTNVGVNTNTAAGIGNRAQQQTLGFQQGGFPFGPGAAFGAGGGAPLVSTNVGVNTNTAAGIGNKAKQGVAGVSIDFGKGGFGRGGSLVDTNVNVNTNVAAGIGNSAGQGVFGLQGR